MLSGGVDLALMLWALWEAQAGWLATNGLALIESAAWTGVWVFVITAFVCKKLKIEDGPVVFAVTVTALAAFGLLIVLDFYTPKSAGEWGDFVGGFFAVPALIWFITAVFLQREELKLQRTELKRQRKELKRQRKELKHQRKEQTRNVVEQEKIAKSVELSAETGLHQILSLNSNRIARNISLLEGVYKGFIIDEYKNKYWIHKKKIKRLGINDVNVNYNSKLKLLNIVILFTNGRRKLKKEIKYCFFVDANNDMSRVNLIFKDMSMYCLRNEILEKLFVFRNYVLQGVDRGTLLQYFGTYIEENGDYSGLRPTVSTHFDWLNFLIDVIKYQETQPQP